MRGTMATVLIADDEPKIVRLVAGYLEREGHRTLHAGTGRQAVELFRAHRPDLAVLDVMMPDLDGIEAARAMLRESDIPIIFLTARAGEADRVAGLELGADDYVVKPFAMEELAARIEAVLRRRPATPATITYEDLTVDVEGHRVMRAGEPIPLTPKEFLLLELMARKPNRVFTRETLMALLWPSNESVDDNLLDAHATNLRQKLEASGGRRLIQTVRGIGFVLR